MRRSKEYFGLCLLLFTSSLLAQKVSVKNNVAARQVVFGNQSIMLTLSYNRQAALTSVQLNGHEVLDITGVYTALNASDGIISSTKLTADPILTITGNRIQISHIVYGPIEETWTFIVTSADIEFDIDRKSAISFQADQVALPTFRFAGINIWEGAYQDYGGIAWFYLFNKPLDTYGVHSKVSTFWNSHTDLGLNVKVDAPDKEVAMNYSRTSDGKLSFNIGVADSSFIPRFDSGTQRRLFLRDRTDVWAPVTVSAGTTHYRITLSGFSFKDRYGRGNFQGLNSDQVSAVLNTIARIGVIGKQHFGGNSWHTPYGPICLHEQYIAQMGLAINDSNYLKGYQDCLDYYQEHAIKSDGRVWPRWAYTNEDMMPNEVNDKGFYEAQWGYLLDANPDLVTNVAELYDQTGDLSWAKTHQLSCEKALDWLMNRDSNRNGLVEMITDSHNQKKSSDWIDIVWASYENAFVNAKLYHALVLWSAIERQLGASVNADRYAGFAANLKSSFNKPTSEGGLWDTARQCYIHWRDKDGSVHGNNMVTPVNFMAIAYGICTDSVRIRAILEGIETQMKKENLFFWPLCLSSYKKGEVNDWQIPFPEYENGDLFLSWGSVGVKAYAAYKPELALKYVKNVLARYGKDGLAFQRYGRAKQDGRGDDILSGNCLSVVGLYQAIYGINPLYNRFYLDPHLTKSVTGTRVRYNYRGQKLVIDLAMDHFVIANDRFKIAARRDFGFFSSGDTVSCFNGSDTAASIVASVTGGAPLSLDIKAFSATRIIWSHSSKGHKTAITYALHNLLPSTIFSVALQNKPTISVRSDATGGIRFTISTGPGADVVTVLKK